MLDELTATVVIKRDGRCRKCGKPGKRDMFGLHWAHIFGKNHRCVRWESVNAMTLCHDCHLGWAHKEPDDFMEWCRTELGDAEFQRLTLMANRATKLSSSFYQAAYEKLEEELQWLNRKH